MKYLPVTIAVSFGLTLATIAPAQVIIQRHGHKNVIRTTTINPALTALQGDLISAITSMKAALPIYDGNRVRAIHATHNALVLVDHAMLGPKASARVRPTVSDNVKFKQAHAKYSADQIAASQANMQNGLGYLQAAWKDLQTAVGSNPNNAGLRVGDDLQKAVAEANAALALHANKA